MISNTHKTMDHGPGSPAKSHSFAGDMLTHLRVSIVATLVLGFIVSGVYPVVVWGLAQALFHQKASGSLIKKDGTPTDDDSQAVGSAWLGQPFSDAKYFQPRPSAAGNGYDATASGGTNLGPLSDKLINGVTTPATTQPTTQPEALAFDGVRLRTIHYAVANNIAFKLYTQRADGNGLRTEVPLSKFQDAQGNLNDTALVDAFPHPPADITAPDRMTVVADDFAQPIPADAVTSSASGLDPHITPANATLQIGRVAKARGITTEQVAALIDEHTDGPSLGFLGDPGVNVLALNLALDAKYPAAPVPATPPVAAPATATPATQPAAH
jgi:K+-transporting ATPase ATPase C chain